MSRRTEIPVFVTFGDPPKGPYRLGRIYVPEGGNAALILAELLEASAKFIRDEVEVQGFLKGLEEL